ncbi:MAG: GTPase RsgA [Alistipes indistinctus]
MPETAREASVMSGMGMEPLLERLRDRVTLLSGNSGVGKSTLIRAIDPSLEVRVGEVSDAHHKAAIRPLFGDATRSRSALARSMRRGSRGSGPDPTPDGAEIALVIFPNCPRLAPGYILLQLHAYASSPASARSKRRSRAAR